MRKMAIVLLMVVVLLLVLNLMRTTPIQEQTPLQPPVLEAENMYLPLVQQNGSEEKPSATQPDPYQLAPGEFLAGEGMILNPVTGKEELPPSHEIGLAPGEHWAEGEEWVFEPPTENADSPANPKGGKLAGYIDYGVVKNPPQGCTWIKARYSHYWPPWGGPNCADFRNGYCYSKTSSKKPWENLTGYGAAMPFEYDFGTKVYFAGQEWEVADRGGKIETIDGIPWIDLMTPLYYANYGSIVDICLVKP